ncbi:Ribulose-phosphate 3-epimerase [Candidatus Nitrotoga sp. HW29]|uniref:ribulose-phosphate 3-epimerase n=1 Tax=Candidatus Nitrotoga sp. HW29 TaxID=2886963 RepID=UPI001EF2C355|nr:ribulose-phosphate 3-epimerase [Candidatus Nitrotoga sp. HW29]CAH1905914.1 Ribulose-phosphate 3-epimerase [Candidatus Nitrotoga sp. HW29]
MYKIAPSIISANFAKLGEEIINVLASGADIVHLEVMNKHFIPTFKNGSKACAAIRPITQAPIEIHLTSGYNVDHSLNNLVPEYAKAGANIITFHPEAVDRDAYNLPSFENIERTIDLIHEHGCKAGLALNAGTPFSYLDHVISKVDVVLIMSKQTGLISGQKFIPEAINKVRTARKKINESGRNIILEVHGDVNLGNIAQIAMAGADTFVVGSAIYEAGNEADPNQYDSIVAALHAELAKVSS